MLKCNSKGIDEVDSADLAQQVFLGVLGMFWVLPLDHVQPNEPRQVARRQGELGPVFASVVVSLIGCRDSE